MQAETFQQPIDEKVKTQGDRQTLVQLAVSPAIDDDGLLKDQLGLSKLRGAIAFRSHQNRGSASNIACSV